jgi:hypothetical protein
LLARSEYIPTKESKLADALSREDVMAVEDTLLAMGLDMVPFDLSDASKMIDGATFGAFTRQAERVAREALSHEDFLPVE